MLNALQSSSLDGKLIEPTAPPAGFRQIVHPDAS